MKNIFKENKKLKEENNKLKIKINELQKENTDELLRTQEYYEKIMKKKKIEYLEANYKTKIELNSLKEIEHQHKSDNGLLRQELDMQIEHNKELEAVNKRLRYTMNNAYLLDYIPIKEIEDKIEMLEKENCHETCGIKKLIDCGRQCSIGCTIKNIKKILEE